MPPTSLPRRVALAVVCAAVLVPGIRYLHAQEGVSPSAVDAVFAEWTMDTPGCAVGVSEAGRVTLERAYGMADLEHDAPNTPETIFEAGSVSKQVTAAAVLLLARDGKLRLDDPVRRYVPELPDYGVPLTIRHMLTHTSGLRDWGSLESLAGWPRTTRVYTHAHVLDIVSRQRALNFTPGTEWSYSNTGFNLAAVIVTRVSGTSLAAFTKRRIFEPLGMTHTSWRDDFTRIVKGRAIAYRTRGEGYAMNMPFENVHGNAALLTTVGDLLRWTENYDTPRVGDRAFVDELQTPGRFNDGRRHEYALGLYIRAHRGLREVGHSGSTAGYRAFLARYPDQRVAVAVLCNVDRGDPAASAHRVVDMYLAQRAELEPVPARADERAEPKTLWRPSAADRDAFAGRYHSNEIETTLTVSVEDGALVLHRRPDTAMAMSPRARDAFDTDLGLVRFHRDDTGRILELGVTVDRVWDLRFQRQRDVP